MTTGFACVDIHEYYFNRTAKEVIPNHESVMRNKTRRFRVLVWDPYGTCLHIFIFKFLTWGPYCCSYQHETSTQHSSQQIRNFIKKIPSQKFRGGGGGANLGGGGVKLFWEIPCQICTLQATWSTIGLNCRPWGLLLHVSLHAHVLLSIIRR